MAVNIIQFDSNSILSKITGVQKLAASGNRRRTPLPNQDKILDTLLNGAMELEGLMPWSSNYTFLVKLSENNGANSLAIYKPDEGERPLWDFPDRTLAQREFASYLISQVLGWPSIPTTVLRDGPHGLGSVQLFVEAEYEAHYFNMRDEPAFTETFRRMALFDHIVNNADRKGGHCLKGKNGTIWSIDHGLTFHTHPKLRTVIWEFSNETIPTPLLNNLAHLQSLLEEAELCRILADLISAQEFEAFKMRVKGLVSNGQFPAIRSRRHIPFPPI